MKRNSTVRPNSLNGNDKRELIPNDGIGIDRKTKDFLANVMIGDIKLICLHTHLHWGSRVSKL